MILLKGYISNYIMIFYNTKEDAKNGNNLRTKKTKTK